MKELREININLETMVEERTEELMTKEKMATAGKFASMIGHDLRSPLQAIKNAVYVAINYSDEKEKMIGIIGDSTDESITITVNVDENVKTAYFDPVKIRRVVDNLIKNAGEAIEGSGEITVSVCSKEECLKIEISDTGKGIPKEYLNNLF